MEDLDQANETDVEDVSLAVIDDPRRQEREANVAEDDVLLELALCRSVRHAAASYFSGMAGEL